MGKLTSILIVASFSLITHSAVASIIFEFTIEESNNEITAGDTFSIAFFNDSNFATGISRADFEFLSYDIASLTPATFGIRTCDHCTPAELADIFTFTRLNGGNWQLDLLVGETGRNTFFVGQNSENYMQLAQTASGIGPTSLSFGTSTFSESASINFPDGPVTLTASTVAVSAPSALSLILVGLCGLIVRRKYR
ncbi:MAG: hypothetical protein Alis3KO_02510 [Aliiglaciecola sp.]